MCVGLASVLKVDCPATVDGVVDGPLVDVFGPVGRLRFVPLVVPVFVLVLEPCGA